MTEDFTLIHQKIEEKREEIKASDADIEVLDYGAGKPEDNRSKEEMQKGVSVWVPLSNLASIGVKEEKAKIIHQLFGELQPSIVLELGTCLGFSSAYMGFFAPKAHIYTIEGCENIATIAQDNHDFFGLENVHIYTGRFDIVLPRLLKQIKPIDFAFIDGHHDHDATIEYFNQILPAMNPKGIMLFDDISWSEGMKSAWQEISSSEHISRSESFCNMGAVWLSNS